MKTFASRNQWVVMICRSYGEPAVASLLHWILLEDMNLKYCKVFTYKGNIMLMS